VNLNDINDPILDWVEERGGGYVWEPEIFSVTLLDASIDDEDADRLSRLVGVKQIAVDASRISLDGLRKLAGIPGIASLVISKGGLTEHDIEQLRTTCQDVQLIG
jgi:hypothetical protein